MGNAIRILIVAGWLVFFGAHALDHLLPGLGLSERRDLRSILSVQLGRTVVYELLSGPDGATRSVGSLQSTWTAEDARYRGELRLTLRDLSVLPGADQLRLMLAGHGGSDGTIAGSIEQVFDERYRLLSVSGRASAFGMQARGEAVVEGDGLRGTWEIPGSPSQPFALAGIGAGDAQGLDLAMALPPRLQPGDRYLTRSLGVDGAMRVAARPLEVRVVGRERLPGTPGGPELLRVEIRADRHPAGILWCDAEGTVHRAQREDLGLSVVLVRVVGPSGEVLWPAPAVRP